MPWELFWLLHCHCGLEEFVAEIKFLDEELGGPESCKRRESISFHIGFETDLVTSVKLDLLGSHGNCWFRLRLNNLRNDNDGFSWFERQNLFDFNVKIA